MPLINAALSVIAFVLGRTRLILLSLSTILLIKISIAAAFQLAL